MFGWLKSWIEWSLLPIRGGFSELDFQIEKLRMLRDSYQPAFQEQQLDQVPDVKKGAECMCIQ